MTLAGLGGVLIAPLFQLNDNTYLFVVLASLAAVALAGIRSIPLAFAAGLGKVTPKDLRASFCSLAGRRRVDPVEAAQLTGHSLNVWTRYYARSFGKAQRDEARARMLEHGFGAVDDVEPDATPLR